VPLADESVKRIARRYYAERVTGKALPEQVKTSESLAWLAEQTWFIRDPSRLSENFPLAVKHLLTPQAYRQKVLLDLIALEGEIGAGYRHLSELVLRGLVGTILTTNFDTRRGARTRFCRLRARQPRRRSRSRSTRRRLRPR
jgi:hypothetical protein